ncbi:MAG: right-handed parallel beta-helix repeat-containing protein [Bacillota bacterium]
MRCSILRKGVLVFFLASMPALAFGVTVDSTAALVAAVRDGAEGTTIEIAAGTYELQGPLELKTRMMLKGAGIDKTILTNAAGWKPPTKTLPDPEMKTDGMDTRAYLIRMQDNAADVTVSDLTLRGPQLHGAIYAWNNKNLHLHHLRIQDTLWSGIRTFLMREAKIHDCEFIDAGGRWDRGQPGVKGGITGGGIFAIWMADCEIADNRFVRTQTGPADEFYGIKARQGKRCRIHHNTIEANFSIEMPFEGDEDVEIDHNVCHGTISIPKYAGGPVPKSGRTFHIHHNWFRDSYAIEFVRNGVEIDHNLFDFDVKRDHGNLISGFGQVAAKGPASFHDNLVSNPGRGVIWINEVYNNLEIRNNHIIAHTTVTPRKDGLFGFDPACDFKTIVVRDNVIECQGESRPLLRCKESYGAVIENNQLTNISDTERYANPKGERRPGLVEPLKFECGVHGEFTVDGWQAVRSK